MDNLRIYKKIDVINPTMIAGWPGMGNVALGVVDYLRRKLGAVKFAELTLDPVSTVDSVVVENGLAAVPPPPKTVFYFTSKPDLILCEGEVQLSGQAGIKLLQSVLTLAVEHKVKTIYTGAAFPMPISCKEDSEVYGAVSNKGMLPMLSKIKIKAMESGHISGLNGLVLGLAQEKGVDAACFLATMPQYAVSLPNPKASRAVIETLRKLVGFKISFDEIDEDIKDMDEKMALIEDKVKDVFTLEKDETPLASEKKVPGYIMEKIERLFGEAKQDRSKAILLKRELDRWDLYKVYEDRFLDLFKDSQ